MGSPRFAGSARAMGRRSQDGDHSDYNGAYGIAVDSSGNAYVTGVTNSADFPVTACAFVTPNRAPPPQGDVFAVKLNPLGSALLYSSVFGGNGTDYGVAITVDASGNAYVAGRTFAFGSTYSSIPTTPNALQRCGSDDAFVAKLDAGGSALLYSSHLGGPMISSQTGPVEWAPTWMALPSALLGSPETRLMLTVSDSRGFVAGAQNGLTIAVRGRLF